MFTSNATFRRINEYPSREMTSSAKSSKKYKNKKAKKDKNGRYNLIVDDSERQNANTHKSQYGSFGANASESPCTYNATYGGSYDLDREPSNSFSINKDVQPGA